MGIYNRYILPCCIDMSCGAKSVAKLREKVVPLAKGVVVEIGIGSGHNLPHYNPNEVSKIMGVDPNEYVWKRSAKRRAASPFK